jgi:hypothetical protein
MNSPKKQMSMKHEKLRTPCPADENILGKYETGSGSPRTADRKMLQAFALQM